MRVVAYAVIYLLNAMEILIIARCIVSFIPNLRENQIIKYIYWITEPVLTPARILLDKFMRDKAFPMDFSPLATYLLIMLLRALIQGMM